MAVYDNTPNVGGGSSTGMTYDPARFEAWAKELLELVNDKMLGYIKEYNKETEDFVQPNVWSGADAQVNFEDRKEIAQLFIDFMNSFTSGLADGMNAVNAQMRDLAIANAASTTNLSNYGNLSATQLEEQASANVNIDTVAYDFTKLDAIHSRSEITTQKMLDTLDDISRKSAKLTNEGIMTGSGAENIESKLISVVTSCKDAFAPIYDRNNKNVKQAIENARTANANISNM